MADLAEHLVRRPARRAALEAAGLSRRELRGPLWRPPYRGVRAWALLPEDDPDARMHAAAQLLPPDGALGGWAAARLLGAQGVDGATPWGALQPVLLVVPPHRRLTTRTGVEVLRSALLPGERVVVDGVPATSPARTVLDVARRGPAHETVPVLDALLRVARLRPDELPAAIAAHAGARGMVQARRTLRLCDPGAESPMESRFRLAWHEAGRAGVRANVVVRDRDGGFLGRVDLLDADAGVFGEFDGEVHASRAVRTSDYRRQRGLERAGLLAVRATSLDVLGDRRPLLEDIWATVARGLTRDRSRDGWSVDP